MKAYHAMTGTTVEVERFDETHAWFRFHPEGELIRAERFALDPIAEPPAVCGAQYVTGGSDPSSAECHLEPGHPVEVKHCGDSPFGEGVILWYGGAIAGGDRTPYREVEFID